MARARLASLVLSLLAASVALAPRAIADEPKKPEAKGVDFASGLSFDDAVAKAKQAGRPLFVDFWSDG